MLPEGWRDLLLDDIAKRNSGHTPSKENPDYWNGGIKWVSLADSWRLDRGLISETDKEISEDGIKNSSAVLLPEGAVVISRDAGVGKSAVISRPMAVSQHFIAWDCGQSADLHNWFLYHWLQSKKTEFERVANGSAIKTIGLSYFKKMRLMVPPKTEQRKIAWLLNLWDDAIATAEQLLVSSKKQKHGLLLQMISGKKRLKNFSRIAKRQKTPHGSIPADWRYVKVEEVASEVSLKNAALMAAPVLSCTKHAGLVDSLDYFKKQVFSKDLSTYKVVPRNCFVYATNHIEEGSIGHQDLYDAGLVSPMYTVFKTTADVDDRYLYRLLKTEHFRQIFQAATNSSVDRRGSLRWKDFKKLHLPLPPLKEQAAIADIVDTLDREIELLQKQLEALKAEKIALMQQLLTGKRRVTLPATVKPPSAKPKSAKPTAVRDRRK